MKNEIKISLGRPGYLIGEKGKTIALFTQRLNITLGTYVKILIEEDNLYDHLYPIDYREY